MKIKLASAENDADYIRRVRIDTLKSVGVEPTRAMTEPVPFASYLVAYNDDSGQAMGMAESAIFSDAYGTYDNAPTSAICDLSRYCPIDQMAGMRTIYVEPEFRDATGIFLALTLASAQLFHNQGARYATATTSSSAHHLRKLYLKLGAEFGGQMDHDGIDMALFVFDLEHLLRRRAMQRVSQYFAFETEMAIA